jgi:glutamate synthase domain-containing protein 1/glutamate synthase domain-containing protein 3
MTDAAAIIRSRRELISGMSPGARRTLEGGCGVIGIIGTEPLAGRYIIRSCEQMRNRGNGKGGGVAAAGLFEGYKNHYAIHIAYLDEAVRGELEDEFLLHKFDIAQAEKQQSLEDHREAGLEVRPPAVWRYFARAKRAPLEAFATSNGIQDEASAEDEFVYQNSFQLNYRYYAASQPPRAFVLSHGRDLMILKAVGFAEQVCRFYRLEELKANLWIGHQRYPTRGRVWHPGGAHPFAGLHEALVHNGDFANYYAVTEYLRQRGIMPLFVTDTEVSVLLFDLYARILGYPLEFVIEALGPTPEGDFERLSKRRQRIYRAIQTAHMHGSPDGPWFFIVARVEPDTGAPQLIGITDVSMLRPQVFALQVGEKSYGAIASEKQAIDAFFEEVSSDDRSVPPLADRYWNARGGSCTDGGAFVYTLRRQNGKPALDVRDKFGNQITVRNAVSSSHNKRGVPNLRRSFQTGPERLEALIAGGSPARDGMREVRTGATAAFHAVISEPGEGWKPGLFTSESLKYGWLPCFRHEEERTASVLRRDLQGACFQRFAQGAAQLVQEAGWRTALGALTVLRDRRWHPGSGRRSTQVAAIDEAIHRLLDALPGPAHRDRKYAVVRLDWRCAWEHPMPMASEAEDVLVVDACGFPAQGRESVSRLLVEARGRNWKRLIVYRLRGDRFIGCGLGPQTGDMRIDVYGSSGDYLGSGVDGAQIYVHGDAQDQVGQILKSGRIVVFGNVGQTLLYGAKGGEAYIMGSAAGRPLINAVGSIRAVINGTCLDYCAESFMAGEQLGGGFVIINGLTFDDRGEVIGLEIKYPGNNLFSLASGGACYLNDPYNTVSETQLNGASFVPFKQADFHIILPYLCTNRDLFGISIRDDLLMVDGVLKWPKEVFRKVVASRATGKLDWSSLPA